MMIDILSQDTRSASAFEQLFNYAEANGLALGGLQPNKKDPFENKDFHPLAFYSRQRADWDRWRISGMNFALPGKPNNLLLVDIDVAAVGGSNAAWGAYVKWLATIDVTAPQKPGDPFYPQSSSPSGGWHVYVQLPETLPYALRDYRIPVRTADVRPLTDAEKADKQGNKECVGVRFGMYLVAPGSYYDGSKLGSTAGHYTLLHAVPPYGCPPKLLELMRKDDVNVAPSPDSMRDVEELLPLLPRHVLEKLNEDVPKGERSDAIPRAVIPLIAGGFSDDEIFNLLWAHPLGEKGREQGETWLRNDIKRQRAKGFGASPSVAQMFGNVTNVASPPLAPGALPPPPGEKPKPPRYLFETVSDLRNMPAAKWLVDRWIPEQGVGLIYGEYASGKSFILFDLLLHLAYGLPEWHGAKLPCAPCDVLLIAREGATGFQGRVDAFKARHGITEDTDRIVFMRSPANMGDRAQFAELKTAIETCGRKFRVVGVDTVGRALPGEDFYDPKSITAFMEHLQQLGEIGNGVSIGVHHVNKSGDVFGSVYFGASSDFMFEVVRDGDPKKDPLRRGKITCSKMKDGEDGWKRRIDYQKVANSLVVAGITEAVGLLGESTRKLTKHDKLALQALGETLRAVGKLRPEMPGRSVTIDQWLDHCFKIGAVAPDAAKPRRDLHNRQVNLLAEKVILVQDDLVRIIDQGVPVHTATTGDMRGLSPLPHLPIQPRTGQGQDRQPL
ncbi:MAG: AAA family ATPase [Xanthobacteraceae bacterium]